jgi:tRNA pseudouridine13 synthase
MNIPRPEGFIVNELPGDYGLGEHTHFTLWKKNWNTLDAIKEIAKKLGVKKERFGYAGLKDKNAVTTQRISAWRIPKKRLKELRIKNIKITNIQENKERITIGSHKGNQFIIILKGITFEEVKKTNKVPNLFGPQRFGGNARLGKLLINNDLKGIIKEFSKNPHGSYEKKVINYLKNKPGDYLNAIKKVNKKIRALWVNAWQAKKWNNNLDTNKEFQKLIEVKRIKDMPELGVFTGPERRTIINLKDLKINRVKSGLKLEFTLPKGSYATTVINYLTNNLKNTTSYKE